MAMLRLANLAFALATAAADPTKLRGASERVKPARRLQNSYVYVDGPRVGNTAWKGPNWPADTNCYWYEVNEKFNWEEAKAFCDQYDNCTIMHDYLCDEKNWRFCKVGLDALVSVSPRTQGCTRIKIPMTVTQTTATDTETTTSHTMFTVTATTGTDTTKTTTKTTVTTTNTGTKTTTTSTTVTTTSVTTSVTTTSTITTTTTALVKYRECPNVLNPSWKDNCSDTTYTLDEAKGKCNNDPNCKWLHDYNCDGRKWRYCDGHITDAQQDHQNGAENKACTMCKEEYSAFVDGPGVANTAWEDLRCDPAFKGTREEAEMECLKTPSCTVIHDYGCNDAQWRVCFVPLNVIEEVPGTGACTRILYLPSSTTTTATVTGTGTKTTTTTTTTSSMHYVEGPHVNPRAWRKHCYATLYENLAEAQEACELDSDCSVTFDWGCDGRHVRICHSDIDALWAEGPGDACTYIATPPTNPSYFKDGPMVSNEAWHKMCSDWTGTLEEAVRYCNMMPGCNALHDFDCDGWSYRYCTVDVKALVLHSQEFDDTMACTKARDSHKKSIYTEGPHVHNRANKVHCNQSWYGSVEEAEAMCDADATCTVLHDWGCDGVNWRFCFSDLRSIQTEYEGNKDACTRIAPQFVSSARVSSCAYTHCSVWTGSRLEAEQKCIEDVTCNAIFDYACDGLGWRWCNATMEELHADTCKEDAIAYSYAHAQANCGAAGCYTTTCPPPVEDACVLPLRKIATTTSTTTMCNTGIFFVDGPRVGNTGYIEHCSEWFGSYGEAMAFCRCNPACMGLHDWNCDATNWRWCETSIDTIKEEYNSTDACTKVIVTTTSTTSTTTTITTTTHTTVTTTHTTVTTSATATTASSVTTTTDTDTTETSTGTTASSTATSHTETTVSTTTVTATDTTASTTTKTTITSTETFYTTTTTLTTTTVTTTTGTDTSVTSITSVTSVTSTTSFTVLSDTDTSTTVTKTTITTTTPAPTTTTETSTLFYYEEGPGAGNTVWKGPLSGPANCFWFDDDPMFNLELAQLECNKYPNCTALHDYLGDDKNWRFCRVPVETLVAETGPASSLGRTMLKQPLSSRCSADPSCSGR